MALIVDIILLVILALCVYFGWKNGFVKTMSKFLTYTVSFALANALNKFVAPYVKKLPFLANMMTENLAFPEIETDASFFDKFKILFSFLKEDVIANGNAEASKALLKNCIAEMLATMIAFIAIFVVSLLLLKLIFFIVNKLVQKIPVINKFNALLGAVSGLLNGFIWTWLAANIFINFLLPVLNYFNPDIFIMEIANSYILTLCTKINPITYLFWLINLFS